MAEKATIREINAALRVYLFIQNPNSLSDEDWATAIMDLHYIKTQEAKANKVN